MGTSCLIQLGKSGVTLYQHYDGYPEGESGVVEQIRKTLKGSTIRMMADDPAYSAARFIQSYLNFVDPESDRGFGVCTSERGVGRDHVQYRYLLTTEKDSWVLYENPPEKGFPSASSYWRKYDVTPQSK